MAKSDAIKKSKKVRPQKVVKLDSLKQINLNAAGLDIGVSRDLGLCA